MPLSNSLALTSADCPDLSVTSSLYASKPGFTTVTRYCKAGRLPTTNFPLDPVVVRATVAPVAVFVTMTLAPLTAPPEGSTTVPRTLAVCCATAVKAQHMTIRTNLIVLLICTKVLLGVIYKKEIRKGE